MRKFRVDAVIGDIDKAMSKLRDAMSGLQVRTAGFRKEHDELARQVANYKVDLEDVAPYIKND
ncbi:hypothetical protein SAMN05216215_103361 [Saccharopolyspora shandongensis]|uniref:Uncharacterized protein n=1 Tax=Saccharopolyspora shandongensis TaxID=418495 RepID=A0A1H3M5G7_9PSEU|nr:hypothetical protein [Saccharopolyspora shandongensis]SDY71826.1 hypothetical protein SAMN05216215_103361 [Saccharopolyspora shandongensis]